jgi:hypothetical protein
MSITNSDVAHAWAHSDERLVNRRSHNIWFDADGVCYSYAEPQAVMYNGHLVLNREYTNSSTTNKHRSLIVRACPLNNRIYVPESVLLKLANDRNYGHEFDYRQAAIDELTKMFSEEMAAFNELAKKHKKLLKHFQKPYDSLLELRLAIHAIAGTDAVANLRDTNDFGPFLEYMYFSEDRQKNKKARVVKDPAEALAEWLAYKRQDTPGSVVGTYFRPHKKVPDHWESNKGMTISAEQLVRVKKLLLRAGRLSGNFPLPPVVAHSGMTYAGEYRVIGGKYDEVVYGCHRIGSDEITRLMELL